MTPSDKPLTTRPAAASDWPAIEQLLQAAHLPREGAREHLAQFVVGMLGDDIVGTGGLEIYGNCALLRSIAVADAVRGLGHGATLTARLVVQAKLHNVATLILRTTDAQPYFERLGFVACAHDQVPDSVKQSRQFRGACPASAAVMALAI